MRVYRAPPAGRWLVVKLNIYTVASRDPPFFFVPQPQFFFFFSFFLLFLFLSYHRRAPSHAHVVPTCRVALADYHWWRYRSPPFCRQASRLNTGPRRDEAEYAPGGKSIINDATRIFQAYRPSRGRDQGNPQVLSQAAGLWGPTTSTLRRLGLYDSRIAMVRSPWHGLERAGRVMPEIAPLPDKRC